LDKVRVAIVSAILFLSGCSALLFQTLWLRLSSAFGNSVWSAALILSSFMAGLVRHKCEWRLSSGRNDFGARQRFFLLGFDLLGNDSINYPQMSEYKRVETARQLEKESYRLLKRVTQSH
jgi:hypothetical protein